MVVSVRTLRRQLADIAGQAAAGETVIVLRHGHPYALLRPMRPGERCRTQSITSFRDDLRRGVLRAKHRPLRLSWRGEVLGVVVVSLPRDYVLADEQP